MNLQTKYRTERDSLLIFENEEVYFAYRKIEDEIFVEEFYIREDLRGNSTKYFNFAYNIFKEYNVKYIVCTVAPRTVGCERALKAFLNYGFRILKCDDEKIFLFLGVN